MKTQDKEQFLLDTLNTMIQSCEPVYYKSINKKFPQIDNKLVEAEKENDCIGLTIVDKSPQHFDNITWGFSTISLIATITDCLIDKRLAVIVETDGPDKGVINGFTFFDRSKEYHPCERMDDVIS
jgi:hypothetical protein